ncbi:MULTISPECIES: hypothetical protein [Streptomyces]|uniref:Uncharacterized protein n=2 Tax=Streptomyces TaxID=1883 RepID=A0A100Y122_9ACTN|nr:MULTISPECIES: hypothetical protein [Streptomyces]KUH35694.1 hypothetical protein ATE80_27725 [Streptomyces kanasensis]UUS31449.1 hypothetical protein NRO40_11805 [Streptomyces changanensis]
MHDTTELTEAVGRLCDRLRSAPQSRLRQGAAAGGLALAGELAVRAHRLEAAPGEPRRMPDAGVFAVGDQLAVAGADFVEAWRAAVAAARDDAARREVLRAEWDDAVALVRDAAARLAV